MHSHSVQITFIYLFQLQHRNNIIYKLPKWKFYGHLHSWTKVLVQICTSGAFAHVPDTNLTSPAYNLASTSRTTLRTSTLYMQFHLFLNIVLGGEGGHQCIFKGYSSIFANYNSKTQGSRVRVMVRALASSMCPGFDSRTRRHNVG